MQGKKGRGKPITGEGEREREARKRGQVREKDGKQGKKGR